MDAKQTLSATELQERVRQRGIEATPSLVFRAMRGLLADGKIRKVLTARGYIAGCGNRAIALFCPGCGKVVEVPCDPVFEALDRIAAGHGFTVSQPMVEVAGRCRECSRRGEDRPETSKAAPARHSRAESEGA